MPLSIWTLPAAFKNAFSGVLRFFQAERNGKIQGIIAIVALGAGIWLRLSGPELAVILLCCGLVIGLEMINSALEKLCDFIKPDRDPRIGLVKDLAAGAVLWASVASAVIGTVIFLPHLMSLFR